MNATLGQIRQVLELGGSVMFDHPRGAAFLVSPLGSKVSIDGRSYQGFLRTVAPKLIRTEVGSVDTRDLVITWRAK